MDFLRVALTHATARSHGKAPFFFSRFNFQRMKERGNTHYCFHCGGSWGFKPKRNGQATNCEDDKVVLYKANGDGVKIAEALNDPKLEPHITDSPGYPRRKPGQRNYEEWLDYSAHFDFSKSFARWAERNGYKVYRYNPMENHDPKTHANAVVEGAGKYRWVHDWFENVKLPEDFPYIVSLT